MLRTTRILTLLCAAIVLAALPSRASGNRALLIGISQYADPEMNDLAFADEDVKTFGSILKEYGDYQKSDIDTLLNDQATKQKIVTTIVDLVKDSQKHPLDHFIMMYAGHGLPSTIQSNKTNAFLAPHDAYLNQFFPEGAGDLLGNETFINKAWLIRQLETMNAKNIIIILDSCYSGAKDFGQLYSEDLGFRTEFTTGGDSKRGITVVRKKGADRTLDRRIAFLASSRENQPSAEYPELHHGALSYTMFSYLDKVRNETEVGPMKDVTVEGMYSGISGLFDTVQVKGQALSTVHQPVLFPIPDYDAMKDMRFMAIRGVKIPKIAKVEPGEAPPPPPPAKATGEVYLDTGQDPCEVIIDGEKTGRNSNDNFELSPGKHLVALFLPQTQYNHTLMVEVQAGEKQRVEVSLRGELAVESRPAKDGGSAPRLEVYVDGSYMGRTGLNLKDLVAGTHTLEVSANDTRKSRQIEIRPNSPLLVRYKIILKPVKVPAKEDNGAGDVTF